MQQDSGSDRATKAETIARNLAEDIIQGRLPPGAVLDETLVAARFGVSRTPIREAIRQLTASGVLETRAHRGAMVRDFSEQQLDEMFAVMAELEGLCARWAALAMTSQERDDLKAMQREGERLAARGHRVRYVAANDVFHEAIYLGAHNAYLRQMTLETRARLAPFRRAQFDAPGRLAQSSIEHARVVEAIVARDVDLAYHTMRAHIVVVRVAFDRLAESDGA